VLLPAGEEVRHAVNGWPVWFTREVGRGKVVFTTLGPRAWLPPLRPRDRFPAAGPREFLVTMAAELQPAPEKDAFPTKAIRQALADEVGYAVVGGPTVGLVFGAFLLGTLGLGLVLRRTRHPELLGWLAPAVALGTAAAFLALGRASHHAVPPTVAVAQVVNAVAGEDEAAVHGLLAAYRPGSGPADIGATRGGTFDLDMTGVEGKARERVVTDVDAWHWDNLSLPVGIRFAPFHCTVPTKAPLTAVARFGPDGLEGKLVSGPFRNPGDALLVTPGRRNLAVRLGPGNFFTAGEGDVLPAGQFLSDAVLSDRQQQRQGLYREFLRRPGAEALKGRTALLAWADPVDLHFRLAPDADLVGAALLVLPLELERAAPGTRVTIPGPLLACRRVVGGRETQVPAGSSDRLDADLRFQLPAAALPLKVEGARFVAKISAPARQVTVSGVADGKPVELLRVDSPLDPIRVQLAERLLHLDERGGLHVRLALGESGRQPEPGKAGLRGVERWTIEYLELEVHGRTEK
jgi:hypothetical protein